MLAETPAFFVLKITCSIPDEEIDDRFVFTPSGTSTTEKQGQIGENSEKCNKND